MGAEIGATTSLFAYDDAMARYLKSTGREEIADAADAVAARPARRRRGPGRPRAFFDQVIEIDLSDLRAADQRPPHPGPGPPRQRARRRGRRPRAGRWRSPPPSIGSCTNSSYEDISRAASHRPLRRRQRAGGQGAAAGHPRLRAGAGHHRARRPARRPRAHRRHRAGQRLRPVHRPVGPQRRAGGRRQRDRHLLQPQLPEAQRRAGLDAGLRHLPGDGRGHGPRRAGRLRPDDRHAHQRRRRPRCASSVPVGEELPSKGFTPGESGFLAPPANAVRRRGQGLARHRAPAAARRRSTPGTARTSSTCPS